MKHKNLHPVVNNDFTKEEKCALERMETEAIALRITAAAEVPYSWCVRYSTRLLILRAVRNAGNRNH
jgi:hypothetical protein